MLGLALALQLSTSTAHLGVPIEARVQAAAEFKPDLERSTTDAYSVSVAKQEPQGAQNLWTLAIVPLAVGKIPVTVHWDGPQEAQSDALLDVLEPALPPDAEIADIKEPARASARLWPWLLAALLIGAGAWLWRRYLRNVGIDTDIAQAAPPDPRPAHVIALAELDALAQADLWAQGHYKAFYAAMTEILRRYLERRYQTPALKLTTSELLKQLRLLETERQATATFRDLFERADLVKFAKTVPGAEQGPLDIEAARQFVEATAPAENLAVNRP